MCEVVRCSSSVVRRDCRARSCGTEREETFTVGLVVSICSVRGGRPSGVEWAVCMVFWGHGLVMRTCAWGSSVVGCGGAHFCLRVWWFSD